MLTTMEPLNTTRRVLRLQFLLGLTLLVLGCAEVNAQGTVNTQEGIAIHGYDAVAYHTEGQAVEGRQEFAFRWDGAEWRFASADNRDLFAGDPERYAPAYGGYCAWAVSRNSVADIDPNSFVIHEGQLYLNINQRFNRRFSRSLLQNIERAQENWPGVRAGL